MPSGLRILLFIIGLVAIQVEGAASASAAQGRVRALLVGVSGYPSLPPPQTPRSPRQLVGPRHDVELLSSLLESLGVDRREQLILADGVKASVTDPTRGAIESAFAALISDARVGDVVIVYFAGHGSQQPTAISAVEPDGLDEIFLPLDIGRWEGTVGAVRNAITDDDFDRWFSALEARGAFVWAIFDTCHAATLTRSVGDPADLQETSREVPPSALGIPERVLAPHKGHHADSAPAIRAVATNTRVALYAAQSDETTPELPLPAGSGADRRVHGLFSYTLAEILSAGGVRTFRDLNRQLLFRYAELGRLGPTPDADGALDRVIPLRFGDHAVGAPAGTYMARREGRRWLLQAGQLHGVREGSLWRLSRQAGAGSAGSPVDIVRIVRTDLATSQVEVASGAAVERDCGKFAREGSLESSHVLWAEPCEIIDDRLQLGPTVACTLDEPTRFDLRRCRPVAAGSGPARVAVAGRDTIAPYVVLASGVADAVPVVATSGYWLVPTLALPHSRSWPPIQVLDRDGRPMPQTDRRLWSLLVARRLVNLAATAPGIPAGVSASAQAGRRVPGACIEPGRDLVPGVSAALVEGTRVKLDVHNGAAHPTDVLIVAVDQSGDIEVLYPLDANEHNRLGRGSKVSVCVQLDPAQRDGAGSIFVLTVPVEHPQTPRFDTSALAPITVQTRNLDGRAADAPRRAAGVQVFSWQSVAPD